MSRILQKDVIIRGIKAPLLFRSLCSDLIVTSAGFLIPPIKSLIRNLVTNHSLIIRLMKPSNN